MERTDEKCLVIHTGLITGSIPPRLTSTLSVVGRQIGRRLVREGEIADFIHW